MKKIIIIVVSLILVIAISLGVIFFIKNDDELEVIHENIHLIDLDAQNDATVLKEVPIKYIDSLVVDGNYITYYDEENEVKVKCIEVNNEGKSSLISIYYNNNLLVNNLSSSTVDTILDANNEIKYSKKIFILDKYLIFNIFNDENEEGKITIFNKEGKELFNNPKINDSAGRNILIKDHKVYFEVGTSLYYINLKNENLEAKKY